MKKLFVIGDSISVHYGEYLPTEVSDDFVYIQREGIQEALANINMAVGGNTGDSSGALDFVKNQVKAGFFTYDVLLFNCGLHDIKRNPPEMNLQVAPDLYEKNLCEIVEIAKSNGVFPVFMTTTPVSDDIHHAYLKANHGIERFGADVLEYNKIATDVMNRLVVPVIDLFSFTLPFGDDAYMDHVHYKNEIRKLQAQFIAKELKKLI